MRTRMSVDFGEVGNDLKVSTTKLINKSEEAMEMLARWVQKSAKLRAPRWKGDLARGIRFVKINKRSFNIESTAVNPVTGEGYGRKMEVGGYLDVVPFTYRPGVNQAQVFRIQEWANDKYPSLLQFMPKFIRAKSYKPHIVPAFRKGIEKVKQQLDLVVEKNIKR